MLVGAALAVLSVWAKQTAAPIVLALPTYLWLREGRAVALRFALCLGGVGAAVSLSFVGWLGLEGISFTMFQMPGGHPLHRSTSANQWRIGSDGTFPIHSNVWT